MIIVFGIIAIIGIVTDNNGVAAIAVAVIAAIEIFRLWSNKHGN